MTDDEILARAAEIRTTRAKERRRVQKRLRHLATWGPEARLASKLRMRKHREGMSEEDLEARRAADRARYAYAEEKERRRLYEQRPEVKRRRAQTRISPNG